MYFGSSCSGECVVCACSGGGCLAGHGDDDYQLASKEQLIAIIKTGRYGAKEYNRYLTDDEIFFVKATLARHYGVKA